jgi:hypothetical protein
VFKFINFKFHLFAPSRLLSMIITKSNKHKLSLDLVKANKNGGCTLASLNALMKSVISWLSNLNHLTRRSMFLSLQMVLIVE